MPPCSPPRAIPALRPHGLHRPSKPCTAMQRPRRRSKRRPKRRPRRPPPQFPPLRIPLLHRVPLSLMLLLRRPLLRKLPRLLPAILPLATPFPLQLSQPPQALPRPQTRMSPPRVLPGSRFPPGLWRSIPSPPPALRLRVQWRCSLPSRRKRGEPAGGTPRSRFSG